MKYNQDRDLLPSLRALYKRGGPYQKAAKTVEMVIGRIASGCQDPFEGIALTKHGENRVPKCRKYDLAGFCRLLTVVDDAFCYLLYAGSHDDCEKWLERNRGFAPVVDTKGRLIKATKSDDNLDPKTRVQGSSDYSYGKLYKKLAEADFDFLVESLPRGIVRRIEEFESISDEDEIVEIAKAIEDRERSVAIHDIFVLLRQGNLKAAQTRMLLFRGEVAPPKPETEIKHGEDLRTIPTDSPQYAELFKHFVQTADYRDWMVFMHPEQERVAKAEFSGPAKLVGVSGTGKTCIVVRRAVALAERYPSGNILVLTLNRPLATLIKDLVSVCASSFLSDLEQAKGFEFDLVCVVNVSNGVIPNPVTPERERFRDLSKLYVAMTRAKLQLVLSYSGTHSSYLSKAGGYLRPGNWTEFVSEEQVLDLGALPTLDDLREPVDDKPVDDVPSIGLMTGEQFLYTSGALGLSARLIEKIRSLVAGERESVPDGTPVRWGCLSEAVRDNHAASRARQQFGPEAFKEFQALAERLGIC